MTLLIIIGVALILIGFCALAIVDGEIGGTTFACICLGGGIIVLALSALGCILNGGTL